MTKIIVATVFSVLSTVLYAGITFAADIADDRWKQISLVSGETVVVAEAFNEPRSIGSYSLRVYSSQNTNYPFDEFIAGEIRARDGALIDLISRDLNSDGEQEIIIVLRSAGSGGYVFADAFSYRNGELAMLANVSWLESDADPISALIQAISKD